MFSLQSAIKRRDALQLEQERATEERDKRKKVHDDVREGGWRDIFSVF